MGQKSRRGDRDCATDSPDIYRCHHEDCCRVFSRKTSLTNHLKAHLNVRSRSIYRTKRARQRAAAESAKSALRSDLDPAVSQENDNAVPPTMQSDEDRVHSSSQENGCSSMACDAASRVILSGPDDDLTSSLSDMDRDALSHGSTMFGLDSASSWDCNDDNIHSISDGLDDFPAANYYHLREPRSSCRLFACDNQPSCRKEELDTEFEVESHPAWAHRVDSGEADDVYSRISTSPFPHSPILSNEASVSEPCANLRDEMRAILTEAGVSPICESDSPEAILGTGPTVDLLEDHLNLLHEYRTL